MIDSMLSDANSKISDLEQFYCYAVGKKDPELIALSTYQLAKLEYIRGNKASLQRTLILLDKSLKTSYQNNYIDHYLAAKELLISMYTDLKELQVAELHGREFIDEAFALGSKERMAEGHMLMGRIKREMGDFQECEAQLKKALELSEEAKSYMGRRTKAFSLLHLSYLRRYQQKYQEALSLALQGHTLAKTLQNYSVIVSDFFELAITLNRIDLGYFDNEFGFSSPRAPFNHFLLAEFEYALATAHERQGNVEKAAEHYIKCIDYASKSNSLEQFTNSYNRVMDLLKSNRVTIERLDYESILASNHALVNNISDHTDSDYIFKVVELQIENEKNKREISLIQEKAKTRKLVLFSTITGFLILLLSLLLFQRQKRTALQLKKESEFNRFKTKLFMNVAHEIRTPLTLVLGYLELYQNTQPNKQGTDRHYEAIKQNCDNALEKVSNTIELLKNEQTQVEIKKENTVLEPVLRQCFFSFESIAKMKSLMLDYQVTLPNNFVLATDRKKLESILNNLIENAIKYSPNGKTIFLKSSINGAHLIIQIID